MTDPARSLISAEYWKADTAHRLAEEKFWAANEALRDATPGGKPDPKIAPEIIQDLEDANRKAYEDLIATHAVYKVLKEMANKLGI
jgi:hypothetical protein